MALRGKPPESVQKRLKCLFFGEAGSGKTTAAISFPRPYVIDTERGAENKAYADIIRERGGVLYQTNVFDDLVAEVTALLSDNKDYATLIIDPITTIYDDLIQRSERICASKSKTGDGTEYGRHYAEAKKEWKRLANLLLRLDMNVIVTSHQKNLYAPGGKMEMVGKTFDGPKGLDHLFDLVFEVCKRGNDRVGVVRKTRVEGFPDGDAFAFHYDAIAERYGRSVLERSAEAEVLASEEQVVEARGLVKLATISEEVVTKWFDKARATDWPEMPAAATAKCIEYMKKQRMAQEAAA